MKIKHFILTATTLVLALALALTLSCSSDIEPSQLDNSSSSSGNTGETSYAYCITADNICLIGPFTVNACNGQPSNNCPYGGSSSSVATSEGSCNGFVDGTEREHYGTMKKQFCDSRDGKKYVYVEIGDQTWMAENLNYDVSGSMCYDYNTANCTTYGRLYDWATAMGFDLSCNSSTCSEQVSTKHRGICPSGWHIPSNANWDKLMRYADGSYGTSSPYDSPTAGKYLKAKSGWKSNNGEDTYGFSALPGGIGNLEGDPNIGYGGDWW
jgi:uncharacterized protein (TIGR02145 family)